MTIKKFFLPVLAALGVLFGLFMVFFTTRKPPSPAIPFPPPKPPFTSYIAGSGTIEAASENIAIGTPFNEVVTAVFVEAGDRVLKNAPLFELDTQTLESRRQAAKARLQEAQVRLQDARIRFSLYENLQDKRAVSEDAYNTEFYAFLEKQEAEKVAEKELQVIETNIARSTIRAPENGEVLQVNIHVGENAEQNPFRSNNNTLMLFGRVDELYLRVDIDESDAWRYKKGSSAYAFVRGNSAMRIPLDYVRIEPYVVPKQSLRGDNVEKIDTRVLQVIYRFDRKDYPVYIGQVMDVYIQTEALRRDG
ncbi:MAG: secretion protein HlyD [Chlamydiota bacterium]